VTDLTTPPSGGSMPVSRPFRPGGQATAPQTGVPTFSPARTAASPLDSLTLDKVLATAVRMKASDIHFSCNTPLRNRIDGDLIGMPSFTIPITSEWLSRVLKQAMSTEAWARYEREHEADVSYTVEGLARFRVNVFLQRGLPGAVFRVIPTEIKSIEELGVPQQLKDIAKKPKGLVLVTGPTGSGKSTTLAAMIDAINNTRPDHIMTIEDPIEFVHQNKKSLINQREVGADTISFGEALKRVLRQDPDVIFVGELRDAETISVALTAAETGHLVFGTLHTQSASKTIDRIIDSFDSSQQNQVKSQLADTLQAVIAQTLMKKIGGGRIAATEIMLRTQAVASMIREGNLAQLYSAIQTGSNHGMHTLDQDLLRLVSLGQVTKEHARPLMIDPSTLDNVTAGNVNDDGSSDYEDWTN
jgi:twitching motility protein PilT